MVGVEKGHANRLFYLALPPSVFKPVTSMLKVRSTLRHPPQANKLIIFIIFLVLTRCNEWHDKNLPDV